MSGDQDKPLLAPPDTTAKDKLDDRRCRGRRAGQAAGAKGVHLPPAALQLAAPQLQQLVRRPRPTPSHQQHVPRAARAHQGRPHQRRRAHGRRRVHHERDAVVRDRERAGPPDPRARGALPRPRAVGRGAADQKRQPRGADAVDAGAAGRGRHLRLQAVHGGEENPARRHGRLQAWTHHARAGPARLGQVLAHEGAGQPLPHGQEHHVER
ncbi:hypothetical protein ON010_g10987 [Phytophthora cinnamomi]|nr:hypothetical protein ON010_g10987 [Phytophthora cinnamomi]